MHTQSAGFGGGSSYLDRHESSNFSTRAHLRYENPRGPRILSPFNPSANL